MNLNDVFNTLLEAQRFVEENATTLAFAGTTLFAGVGWVRSVQRAAEEKKALQEKMAAFEKGDATSEVIKWQEVILEPAYEKDPVTGDILFDANFAPKRLINPDTGKQFVDQRIRGIRQIQIMDLVPAGLPLSKDQILDYFHKAKAHMNALYKNGERVVPSPFYYFKEVMTEEHFASYKHATQEAKKAWENRLGRYQDAFKREGTTEMASYFVEATHPNLTMSNKEARELGLQRVERNKCGVVLFEPGAHSEEWRFEEFFLEDLLDKDGLPAQEDLRVPMTNQGKGRLSGIHASVFEKMGRPDLVHCKPGETYFLSNKEHNLLFGEEAKQLQRNETRRILQGEFLNPNADNWYFFPAAYFTGYESVLKPKAQQVSGARRLG